MTRDDICSYSLCRFLHRRSRCIRFSRMALTASNPKGPNFFLFFFFQKLLETSSAWDYSTSFWKLLPRIRLQIFPMFSYCCKSKRTKLLLLLSSSGSFRKLLLRINIPQSRRRSQLSRQILYMKAIQCILLIISSLLSGGMPIISWQTLGHNRES